MRLWIILSLICLLISLLTQTLNFQPEELATVHSTTQHESENRDTQGYTVSYQVVASTIMHIQTLVNSERQLIVKLTLPRHITSTSNSTSKLQIANISHSRKLTRTCFRSIRRAIILHKL